MHKKLLLVILDGWGIGHHDKSDLISASNPQYFNELSKNSLVSELDASEKFVGLPDGQMGNSEVGHLTIGSGRTILQDLVRINHEVDSGSIGQNKVVLEALQYAKDQNKAVHLIALLGSGGVHALSKHIFKMAEIATAQGLEKIYVHGLTDGRDTDPKSGLGFVQETLDALAKTKAKLATLVGRYYTMDRDKRWERIKVGYDAMVHGIGQKTTDFIAAINQSYAENVTDEFLNPLIAVDENNNPVGQIKEGDVVICVNFRTDRLRQITTALTQQDLPEFQMQKMNLKYLTMTRYDDSYQNVNVIYDKENLNQTMGEVIARKQSDTA